MRKNTIKKQNKLKRAVFKLIFLISVVSLIILTKFANQFFFGTEKWLEAINSTEKFNSVNVNWFGNEKNLAVFFFGPIGFNSIINFKTFYSGETLLIPIIIDLAMNWLMILIVIYFLFKVLRFMYRGWKKHTIKKFNKAIELQTLKQTTNINNSLPNLSSPTKQEPIQHNQSVETPKINLDKASTLTEQQDNQKSFVQKSTTIDKVAIIPKSEIKVDLIKEHLTSTPIEIENISKYDSTEKTPLKSDSQTSNVFSAKQIASIPVADSINDFSKHDLAMLRKYAQTFLNLAQTSNLSKAYVQVNLQEMSANEIINYMQAIRNQINQMKKPVQVAR